MNLSHGLPQVLLPIHQPNLLGLRQKRPHGQGFSAVGFHRVRPQDFKGVFVVAVNQGPDGVE